MELEIYRASHGRYGEDDATNPPVKNAKYNLPQVFDNGGKYDGGWTVEVNTVEDLLALAKETNHSIIIHTDGELQIHDDYID